MKSSPCVLAVAEHTGWAHVIGVAAPGRVPAVVVRRRITLIDQGLPTLPYEHGTAAMKEAEADELITRVRRSVDRHCSVALERLAAELSPTCRIVALAIREPPFVELPATVAEVRRSYRLQCAADGMLYQLALCRAATKLGLDVQMCRRGHETARAAQCLNTTPGEVEEFVGRTGRPAGPPWTEEHRRAFAAGIAALAPNVRGGLSLRRAFRLD